MSDVIKYHKVVASLPGTLDANSVYYVRVGTGVDVYVSNDMGIVTAYALNPPSAGTILATELVGLDTAATPSAIVNGDTIIDALGKIQAQLNDTSPVAAAAKLATARTISITGDATWTTSFDGSANATGELTLADSGVTAGTYPKVTVDAKGRVTAGAVLAAADIPALDASKITSGVFPDDRLSGTYTGVNITGNAATATKLATARTISVSGAAVGFVNFDGSSNAEIVTTTPRVNPASDPTSTFRADVFGGADDKIKVLRAGASGYLNFPQYSPCLAWSTYDTHAFFSPTYNSPRIRVGAGSGTGITWQKDLAFTDSDITGNAATATKLQTARTINGVAFDGSANITISDSTKLPLAGGVMTGTLITKITGHAVGHGSGDGSLSVRGDVSSAAVMTFHRGGAYAINLGLDTDNVFRLGGWSDGANVYRFQVDGSGNFTANGNVTAYSDIRLKKDIRVIPDALAKVEQLSGVTYERIDSGERQVGVIAQEVQKVLPEAVIQGEEYLSVAYGNMVGLLIEAIKELNHKVERQAQEIAELRAL